MKPDLFFNFISEHALDDVAKLGLQFSSRIEEFDLRDALTQIEARQKCRNKFPWFLSFQQFLLPSLQAAEQASNQSVALYHAGLIGNGQSVADLTAGLGIDAMTIALNGNKVTAFEIDEARADCLKHNAVVLDIENLDIQNTDSIKALEACDIHFDHIFIDPARRDGDNNRIFKLEDSVPDVISHENLLIEHARTVWIKGSPLLDLTMTLRSLKHVSEIHIISFKGECKEVLIRLEKNIAQPWVHVVDLNKSDGVFPSGHPVINYNFSFLIPDNFACETDAALAGDIMPGNYLYEAGAGMRKVNRPGLVCHRFPGLKALHAGSDLYVSETLYTDFPGRVVKICQVADNKDLKIMKGQRFRIVSRCYPLRADEMRKKFKLKEGEEDAIYATSLMNGAKILIITSEKDFPY